MALAVNDLTALPQEDVQTNLLIIAQLVQEAFPTLSLRRGAFHDLVLLLSAILSTNDQILVERAINSLSLLKITEDPTLADDDIVDAVLSNFRVIRNEGTFATGTIQIILDTAASFSIPAGFQWLANDQLYTTDDTSISRLTPATVNDDQDRLVVPLGNGKFGFTIEATAAAIGETANISNGTQMIPQTALNAAFNSAVAFQDFTGGTDRETNEDLIERLDEGAGLKALSNRATNEALLTTEFLGVIGLSQIGFGDAEMFRDQHQIWPGSSGNRVDMYTRTQQRVGSKQLTVTATLISKLGALGTWSFSLVRDDAPGFYEITAIALKGFLSTGTIYPVITDVRGFDITGSGFVPDIETVLEATYSRYSTTTITFDDTDTDATGLTVGATADYDISVAVLQEIGDIQDFSNQREIQWPGGDVLIKAAVPCFVDIDLTVEVLSTQPIPDEDEIKNAAAEAVNTSGFPGTLAAATVTAAVEAVLSGGIVTAVTLDGRIRQPDGVDVLLASASALVIPNDPVDLVTARTVTFFCAPADVTVTVVVV